MRVAEHENNVSYVTKTGQARGLTSLVLDQKAEIGDVLSKDIARLSGCEGEISAERAPNDQDVRDGVARTGIE